MYRKFILMIAAILAGLTVAFSVTQTSRAGILPGDSTVISGQYTISGFTSNTDVNYNPCTSLTAPTEGYWVWKNGNSLSSGTASSSCTFSQSPDSLNPGSYRYDYNFVYSASYTYTAQAIDAGTTVNLTLDIGSAGNTVASSAVVVDTPAPPTTTTTATTIAATTTAASTTTTTAAAPAGAAPTVNTASTAPATSTSTVTVVYTDTSADARITTLEQEYAALASRVDAIQQANAAAWQTYHDDLVAGIDPATAALDARSAGLNAVYQLGV